MNNQPKLLSGAVELAVARMKARSLNDAYLDDPVAWARDILGVHLWSKQEEICRAVIEHKRVVVRSANGVGKTATMGVLAAWWIATQYPRDPMETIVVTTAPSFGQIQLNMFSELNLEMARSRELYYPDGTKKPKEYQQELPGKISIGTSIAAWKDGSTFLAIGRKPAEQDIITTFQGIHRRNVLFIIDEGGGMHKDMFAAAERMTTNPNAKIVVVGNPDKRGSEFYQLFYGKQADKWHKIKVSAYDTPAFTGEPCPKALLDYMPTPENVQDLIDMWGADDPRIKIGVDGDFPDSDDSIFFPESVVNRAEDTEIDPYVDDIKIFGIDLAMKGADSSKVYLNHGGRIRRLKEWSHATTGNGAEINADNIIELIKIHQPDYVNIDAGGIGEPVIEWLEKKVSQDEACPRFKLTRMNSSEMAPELRRWFDKRAWWYDLLREGMINGRVDLEYDGDVKNQFNVINSSYYDKGNRNGALQIESKKELRKRVGFSPDDVDAIVYSHYDPRIDLDNNKPKEGSTIYETPDEMLGDDIPVYLQLLDSWL